MRIGESNFGRSTVGTLSYADALQRKLAAKRATAERYWRAQAASIGPGDCDCGRGDQQDFADARRMTPGEYARRADFIDCLRRHGWSYAAIGRRLCLSGERVRDIQYRTEHRRSQANLQLTTDLEEIQTILSFASWRKKQEARR